MDDRSTPTATGTGLLEGVRVLDVTRYLPGPFCSLNLAWLGASVTVVEQPPHGDPLRAMPPASAASCKRICNRGG